MNRLHGSVVLALACQLTLGSLAHAQASPSDLEKLWSVSGGLGFTASPGSFLMNFEAERYMRDEVAVGLALQLGVDDDDVLVSPILFARYIFDLSDVTNDIAKKVKPFAQGGLGFTHYDVDKGPKNKSDTDFSMSFGLGLEYPLNETISVGSRMLLNIIPGRVVDERLYLSWELLSIRYSW